MMKTKQLNVWVPEDLRDYVVRRADDEKRPMNAIIAELIREDIVKHNEQLTEQTSLLKLQEMVVAIVRTEVCNAHIQLRRELREDRQFEAETFFVRLQTSLDRLVSLLVTVVRSSGIARRLIYALLSKNHGAPFAKAVYDDAREKVLQELSLKQVSPEPLKRKVPVLP
jgi:hypothetical protein